MRSKSRLIAVVASMLVCVAMVGTGFASWVILSEDSKEATGNVQAEAVSNEGNLSIEITSGASDQNIYFGGPEVQDAEDKWLISDSEIGESLVATFVLKITGPLKDISVAIKVPDNFKTAVEQGDLAAPTLSVKCAKTEVTFGSVSLSPDEANTTYTGTASITSNDEGTSAGHKFTGTDDTVTFTLTFAWGSNFGGKNPYSYFNDGQKTAGGKADGSAEVGGFTQISQWSGKTGVDSTDTWGGVASGVLGQLHTWFPEDSSQQYTVTFSASAVNLKAE